MSAEATVSGSEPTLAMVELAAMWHERLHGSAAGAEERDACLRWRSQHAAHELAWQRMAALWGQFDDLPAEPARAALDAAADATQRALRRRTVRRGVAGAVGVAFAAVLGWAGLGALPPSHLLADQHTRVGETRVVTLADGSRLTLDTRTAIDVRYDDHQRLVVLRAGRLLADVAPDPDRPFVVQTPQGSPRALGTRFSVSRGGAAEGVPQTSVTVIESRVRACATTPPLSCVDLHGGQRVKIRANGPGAVESVDAEATEAWAASRLVADDRPLVDVLAEIARHRPGHLQFDAHALAGVRVSGVLPLDDSDRAMALLAATLPIRVSHFTPWWTRVEPAAPRTN